jgi:hypothetical protein
VRAVAESRAPVGEQLASQPQRWKDDGVSGTVVRQALAAGEGSGPVKGSGAPVERGAQVELPNDGLVRPTSSVDWI